MKLWCELALVGGRVQADVELTVEDGRYTAIETGVARSAEAERRTGLSLPGLANSHSHAFHRALRGHSQADSGSFWTWRRLMYRVAERLDPDSYLRLARATYAEMACAGIVAVGEFHYLHHSPDGTPYGTSNAMGDALVEAAADAGIRLTMLDTLYQHGGLGPTGPTPPEGVQRRYCDASVDHWMSRIDDRSRADHVQLGVAVHSVRAVDPAGAAAAAQWADRNRAPIHAHVSEQPAENDACMAHHGMTSTALLASVGVVGPAFTAVHATHADDGDIELLGDGGATVCFCPTTERDLGDGVGPSSELVTAGAALSLGSDSHAVIDLLSEARLLELHERLRTGRRGLHRTQSLIDMATTNGHHCLGWDDAGTLAVGNRADLVTIDMSSKRTAGSIVGDRSVDHALNAAVFAATADDITDVMIDGRPVVADRSHRNVDVAAELQSAIAEVVTDD